MLILMSFYGVSESPHQESNLGLDLRTVVWSPFHHEEFARTAGVEPGLVRVEGLEPSSRLLKREDSGQLSYTRTRPSGWNRTTVVNDASFTARLRSTRADG